MRKSRARKGTLLCALLCLCLSSTVFANEGMITLNKPQWIAAPKKPMQLFGDYLASGSCGVTEVEPGVVCMEGDTMCYSDVEEVTVKVYLEYYDEEDDGWYNLDIKKGTAYDTSMVGVWKDVVVMRDMYYRARGFHCAIADLGETVETQSSVSPRIYID